MINRRLYPLSLHDTMIALGFRPWKVFDDIVQGAYAQVEDQRRNIHEGVNYFSLPCVLVPDARRSFPGEELNGRTVFYKYSISNQHASRFADLCLKSASRYLQRTR